MASMGYKRMLYFLLAVACGYFAFSSRLFAATDFDPWLLEPGKHAGPITLHTSEEDLKAFYGASNVVNIAEGDESNECEEGLLCTIIFPKNSAKRLEVYWEDSAQRKRPNEVRVVAPSAWATSWHLSNGMGIGTSLKAIEAMNNGPFDINGYFCDAGGVVSDWHNGLLTDILPLALVRIQLSPTLDMAKKENEHYVSENLVGCDNKFSSDSAAVLHIQPKIGFIGILLK